MGGGPGEAGYLTESALSALERASAIFVEPEVRPALGDRQEWLDKVQTKPPPRVALGRFDEIEAVWLVPGTPSLYPPVGEWIGELSPEEWQYIEIISGVLASSTALDKGGIFLPPRHAVVLQDENENLLLSWRNHKWEGEWMRRALDWSKSRPMSGRHIILLRSSARMSRVVRWFENWGAVAEMVPVSRLAEADNYEVVDTAIRRLNRYDWMILTSGEAVSYWFRRMYQLGVDVRQIRAKIAVVGPETAMAVREQGLVPELMSTTDYSQEGMARAFEEVPLRGALVLFAGGQLNRKFLADELRGRGALVDEVVLYHNVLVPLPLSLHHAIRAERPDAILFTASSQVEYLVEQLSLDDRRHLSHIPAFSIGPLTTRTLRHYGVEPAGEAAQPSLRLLAERVRDYYQASSSGN